MGHAIIVKSGGGGVTSDDVTAYRSQVLEGKTTITVDSGDELATGTMLSDATISNAGELLENVVAYGRHGTKHTGTLLSDANINNADQMLSGVVAYGRNGAKYTGNIASMNGGTYTPSTSQQTISCSGKKMNSNIIINAIPSTYINIGGSGSSWTTFNNGTFASGWAFAPKYWDATTNSYTSTSVQTVTKTDGNGVTRTGYVTKSGNVYSNGYYEAEPRKMMLVLNRAVNITNIKEVRMYWFTNYTWTTNRDTKLMYLLNTSNKSIAKTYSRLYYDPDNSYTRFVTVTFDVSDVNGTYFISWASYWYEQCLAQIQFIKK